MIALMYHDIVEAGREEASGFPGRDADSYKVTIARFRRHLEAIALGRKTKPLPTFTFDDGGIGARLAADCLEAQGWRGYFFVTTNYIGTPGFLDAASIRDLDRRGHIVGSHSCSHPLRIGHCSIAQLQDEWTRSRDLMSTILGRPVAFASVPGGDFQPPVAEAGGAAGFTDLFTSQPTAESRPSFGLTLHGRYTVRSWTKPATAAALAAGDYLPCARQALTWNVKKLGKQLGGERYLRVRQLVLGDGRHVQWGDCRD